ncbi:MAG: DUF1990 domain-containing protein [Caldilineaceae bacterium]|nr:DUF1990 domain-containing protein [Caldilineaceae bacterium]
MFLYRTKPTQTEIERVLAASQSLPYNYPDVGATNALINAPELSTTYVMDHNRVLLGRGEATFARARQAIMHWRMCNLGWATICGRVEPIATGTVIACVPQMFGLWLVNPCRVVYTIDETNHDISRFGLAYGTLPGHAAAGEERFMVEWHHADDTVWYDIVAFSKAGGPLAQLGYPVMRRFQLRYGRHSAQAMVDACAVKGVSHSFGITAKDHLNRPV